MKVVTQKGQELKVTQFVKWEETHKKYEGIAYCVSDKGVEYLAFVLKGSQNVELQYCGSFNTRKSGNGVIEGIEILPYIPTNIPDQYSVQSTTHFEKAILDKFGIATKIEINGREMVISFQTVQSASTLLRAFKRDKPVIKCLDYLNYQMILSL